MLQELTIRNVALLDEVRLSFAEGLNVLTGETGAGKSIVIDAIGAVLGGRVTTDLIRSGADRAVVEALFALPRHDSGPLEALIDELGALADGDDGTLILAREMSRSGRTVGRVNGRAVPVSTLFQIGSLLVDIHGQHEHLSLLKPGAQRDLLDRYGGLTNQRATVGNLVRELRRARAELEAMHADEREVARRVDLLSFQIEEIENARLVPGEHETLEHERVLLVNATRLAELTATVHGALAGDDGGDTPSALDLLGVAARDLGALVVIDATLADQETLLAEAVAQVEEIARAMRSYHNQIEISPDRLDQVTARLDLIRTLQRKYGDTIDDVLAFAAHAAEELEALVNREARTAELESRAASIEREIGDAATALSQARHAAGERLAAAVAHEMRALSLRGAFEVRIEQEDDNNGVPAGGRRLRFDETGIDAVEYYFAPNPGEPAKPVARTASGGELSRILLALKAVLSAADHTPVLIFDEVDAGIGGRSGHVVGERLATLGRQHQVLCVTHLPQIAAYGDVHFLISKYVHGGRTATRVSPLEGPARLAELAQMLGGTTPATTRQASELVERAAAWKRSLDDTSGAETSGADSAAPDPAAPDPAALAPHDGATVGYGGRGAAAAAAQGRARNVSRPQRRSSKDQPLLQGAS